MIRLALTAALLASTTPVLAAPSALLRCDGFGRRVSTGESVARGLVILGTLGLFGSAEADNPAARETGDKGIQACTDAMADQRVTGNPIRRAEVFLARGFRHYEMGHFAAAEEDAKTAQTMVVPDPAKPAFDRTVGVSALLLQALIRTAENKPEEAETLALAAAARRPWGNFTIEQALTVLMLSPTISPGEAKLLDRHFQLWPGSMRAQAREAAGDWAGAASDYAAVIKARVEGDEVLEARRAAVLALAGDTAGAEAAVKAVRQRIDELATKASGTDNAAQVAGQKVARADEMVQLARAQLALLAGRTDDAKAVLAGRERWLAPAPIVARVIANAQAKLGNSGIGSLSLDPAKVLADARAVKLNDLSGKKIVGLMMIAWPRYEDIDKANDFGKDIALPVPQVKQETARDGATLKIGLQREGATDTGNEAMLVLAANVAATRGAAEYAIVQRNSSLRLPREGLSDAFQTWQIVFPTDALWESQKGRSISIAAVQAELAPQFPAPPPVAKR
ncbi:MAG: hypothetical protein CFE37_04730 [Alphaproteobacteria bacterium PA4]|nr:MAG: hypothetical protein CFE37_04730 [Alphaproteobacteria bacterium PA4]